MKSICLTFLLSLSALSSWAQSNQTTKDSLLTWYNDITLASEAAVKAEKPLMLFFTGSDWCGWCHRLQREVFNTEQFNTWAAMDVILCEIDFPKYKVLPQNIQEQNQRLQQQFGVQAYPTVWFVNVSKEDKKYNLSRLKSTGYMQGGPDVWITNAKSIISGGK